MNIFITGIKGFVGSHLANALFEQGHKVLGIDNLFHPCLNITKMEFTYGDIRDKDLVDSFVSKSDIVFHLAAQIHVDYSIEHPQETVDINVSGTLNVLEACRRYKKKLIFASTSEAYGSSQTDVMNEEHPLDCQSPYGASKVAGDRLCKAYIDTYGMDIVIVRNFNIFGPYQNDTSYGSVIAKFTTAAYLGQPLQIYGNGEQERDYMYIDDAIQAYMAAIKLPSGVYNFGTGITVKIKELAELIKKYSNSVSKIEFITARAGEVQRLCADISKSQIHGFKSDTDFNRDLLKYVKWYETTRSAE